MTQIWTMLAMGALGLTALAITLAVALRGWEGWLSLKRMEISTSRDGDARSPAIERIEMADLKERIRKLESIASYVDL